MKRMDWVVQYQGREVKMEEKLVINESNWMHGEYGEGMVCFV